MVCNGDAVLIDIRTIEEAVFVGVPACEPSGKQIAYLIPFNIWDGSIPVIEPKKLPRNPDFQKLIEKTFPAVPWFAWFEPLLFLPTFNMI